MSFINTVPQGVIILNDRDKPSRVGLMEIFCSSEKWLMFVFFFWITGIVSYKEGFRFLVFRRMRAVIN